MGSDVIDIDGFLSSSGFMRLAQLRLTTVRLSDPNHFPLLFSFSSDITQARCSAASLAFEEQCKCTPSKSASTLSSASVTVLKAAPWVPGIQFSVALLIRPMDLEREFAV